jgi:hypothetical protein
MNHSASLPGAQRPTGATNASREGALGVPRVDSQTSWSHALSWGLHQALQGPARTMLWVDADFSAWPLADETLLLALGAWLRQPQRQVCMLALEFGGLARSHPRFVSWRQHWAHAVVGRVLPQELAAQAPRALVAQAQLAVHLVQPEAWRGWASLRRQDVQPLWDISQALWERSEPGFPAHTLGL